MKCEFCKENDVYRINVNQFYCRYCDSKWEGEKVFYGDWKVCEIQIVKNMLLFCPRAKWYKGENIYTVWKLDDPSAYVLVGRSFKDLVDKCKVYKYARIG